MAKQAQGLPEMEPGPAVQLTDRFGNTFHVAFARELQLPAKPLPKGLDYRDVNDAIRNMEIRDNDILICSYPKSGSHWIGNIIMMLVAGKAGFAAEGALLEMGDVFKAQKMSNDSPRQLQTHLPVRYIPKQAFENKIKIFVQHRNPKDILVSDYHMRTKLVGPMKWPGTFEHYFHYKMEMGGPYGDVLDYYMDWQDAIDAHPQVQVLKTVFEDMKKDPVAEVIRINEYLGTNRSAELCADIAKACGFSNLKAARDQKEPDFVKALFKDNKPAFYRKGDVGDWKNHFTVAMNEHFDAVFKKRMSRFKLEYQYTI